ncbi:MAG: secondary thiamine-phosphate synthase enzyme YjbQ, partial [Planctomycetota bacterium]
MTQHQASVEIRTFGKGMVDVTGEVQKAVAASGVQAGLVVVFCTHTSCSLVIQENADPSARRDMERFLERLAPEGHPDNEHTSEGPDDSPSHQRSMITKTS